MLCHCERSEAISITVYAHSWVEIASFGFASQLLKPIASS
jgi:hypothetical protein